MWRKSLSNKIARVFEIVNYLFVVPAALILIVSIFVFLVCLLSLNLVGCIGSLLFILILAFGFALFVGYVKHSRGNLDKSKILPLWMGTFLYNILPLMYVGFQFYTESQQKFARGDLCKFLIFWWMIACSLSLTAVYDEFEFGDRRS